MTKNQESVQGHAKKVSEAAFSTASIFEQIFRDLHFPATKSQIMKYLQFDGNLEILANVQNIEEEEYGDESEVARAAGTGL
jgi:Protein of unknown function (DUF2795)